MDYRKLFIILFLVGNLLAAEGRVRQIVYEPRQFFSTRQIYLRVENSNSIMIVMASGGSARLLFVSLVVGGWISFPTNKRLTNGAYFIKSKDVVVHR